MSKSIFVFTGPHNSGKTTIIKLMRDLFVTSKPTAVKVNLDYKLRADAKDILECYEVDRVKIGFSSAGDVANTVTDRLNALEDCAVIVCAALSQGATQGAAQQWSEQHQMYLSFHPVDSESDATRHAQCNAEKAAEVYAFVAYALCKNGVNM